MLGDNRRIISDLLSFIGQKPQIVKKEQVTLLRSKECKFFEVYLNNAGAYAKYFHKFGHLFRIGLTLTQFSNGTYEICRKGLIKIFKYNELFLGMKPKLNLGHFQKKIKHAIMKPVLEYLERQSSEIEIYQIAQLNGYQVQISYISPISSWIIGSKKYCIIIHDSIELEQYRTSSNEIYHMLFQVGVTWLSLLSRFTDETLSSLKEDMENLTLVGTFVGLNSLIKYSIKLGIYFYSIVQNNSNEISMNIPDSIQFFQQYNLLYCPITKIPDEIKTESDYHNTIQRISEIVSSSYVNTQEAGAIIFTIAKSTKDKVSARKVISVMKINSNERKILSGLHKALSKYINENTKNVESLYYIGKEILMKNNPANILVNELQPYLNSPLPLDNKIYIQIIEMAFESVTENLSELSYANKKGITDLIEHCIITVSKARGIQYPGLTSTLMPIQIQNNSKESDSSGRPILSLVAFHSDNDEEDVNMNMNQKKSPTYQTKFVKSHASRSGIKIVDFSENNKFGMFYTAKEMQFLNGISTNDINPSEILSKENSKNVPLSAEQIFVLENKNLPSRNTSSQKNVSHHSNSKNNVNKSPFFSLSNKKEDWAIDEGIIQIYNCDEDEIKTEKTITNKNIQHDCVSNLNGCSMSNNYVIINNPQNIQQIYNSLSEIPSVSSLERNVRCDRRGIPIIKGNKKHKIAFIDKIDKEKDFAEISNIESYKNYNAENNFIRVGDSQSNQSTSCCTMM